MSNIVIYGLVDPVTNELRYVGQTIKGFKRFKEHIRDVNTEDTHKNKWLKTLLLKGLKPEWFVIEEHTSRAELYEAEIFWIAYFKSIGSRLTNGTTGGDGVRGKAPITAETRLKMSIARRKRPPMSAETRAKVGAASKGRVFSSEHRAKISAALLGKKRVEVRKQRVFNRPKKGSPEYCAQISAKLMGHGVSDETRAKMAAAKLGKPRSAETRAKIGAFQKGRKLSDETRAKMSLSQRNRVSRG